jgi:hypothetical protein
LGNVEIVYVACQNDDVWLAEVNEPGTKPYDWMVRFLVSKIYSCVWMPGQLLTNEDFQQLHSIVQLLGLHLTDENITPVAFNNLVSQIGMF